jgi:hypothetical protein
VIAVTFVAEHHRAEALNAHLDTRATEPPVPQKCPTFPLSVAISFRTRSHMSEPTNCRSWSRL